MKGLLDGVNRLTLDGPFFGRLSDERKTEVIADQIVIVSKNGSAAELPMSKLKTAKERVLDMLYKMIQEEKTVVGARKRLEEGGAIPLENDLFWYKRETNLAPTIVQKK